MVLLFHTSPTTPPNGKGRQVMTIDIKGKFSLNRFFTLDLPWIYSLHHTDSTHFLSSLPVSPILLQKSDVQQ
ncbi:hypothetical protein NPIL_692191 [Nephila pilipes]|uniref:Uncharacterized protein n=1 Tax=Nephila pilipes TaxID=299642 RepID=A0A8X6NYW7_NEPPI|nr:hypothetical protein NPIL_692191 [Nephila pilipes]